MESIVSMTGRLGNNVELRKTSAQQDMVTFRLATNRRYMRNGEWVDGPTTWVTVKCFRQFATNVSMSLRKGDPVVVVGRLEMEEWVTQSGEGRQTLVLYALAVGHDLNWGVTTMHKIARDRTEPPSLEEIQTEPDYDEDPRAQQDDMAGPQDDDLTATEAFAASLGAPIASY